MPAERDKTTRPKSNSIQIISFDKNVCRFNLYYFLHATIVRAARIFWLGIWMNIIHYYYKFIIFKRI